MARTNKAGRTADITSQKPIPPGRRFQRRGDPANEKPVKLMKAYRAFGNIDSLRSRPRQPAGQRQSGFINGAHWEWIGRLPGVCWNRRDATTHLLGLSATQRLARTDQAMRASGLTQSDWARKLRCDPKQIRRLLDGSQLAVRPFGIGLECAGEEARRGCAGRRLTLLSVVLLTQTGLLGRLLAPMGHRYRNR